MECHARPCHQIAYHDIVLLSLIKSLAGNRSIAGATAGQIGAARALGCDGGIFSGGVLNTELAY